MNIIKKYIEYLKDNPENYWFKRKIYGWGWTPARWQGWLVIAVFVFLLVLNGLNISSKSVPTRDESIWFFVKVAILVTAMLIVCYKTGEKPRWQWGHDDKK
jgi:hypothetical protein